MVEGESPGIANIWAVTKAGNDTKAVEVLLMFTGLVVLYQMLLLAG